MIVEAHVVYWTAMGMREDGGSGPGYIERYEVERLLEEAHARGRESGLLEARHNLGDRIGHD